MSVEYSGKWVCQFLNSVTERILDTKEAAMELAASYVGNTACASIFGGKQLIYGPGDGTTSVIVRAEVEFV